MAKRIADVPSDYDSRTFRQIIRDINTRFAALEAAVSVYTVSNYIETRSLDMGTATATDIGNFLATLVNDMQNAGRLGRG